MKKFKLLVFHWGQIRDSRPHRNCYGWCWGLQCYISLPCHQPSVSVQNWLIGDETAPKRCTVIQNSASGWSVSPPGHHRNIRMSTSSSGSLIWWNIPSMSSITATGSCWNLRSTPNKVFSWDQDLATVQSSDKYLETKRYSWRPPGIVFFCFCGRCRGEECTTIFHHSGGAVLLALSLHVLSSRRHSWRWCNLSEMLHLSWIFG